MTRQIRVGSGIASDPLKCFYFINSASILNRADALSKIHPTFERPLSKEWAR